MGEQALVHLPFVKKNLIVQDVFLNFSLVYPANLSNHYSPRFKPWATVV